MRKPELSSRADSAWCPGCGNFAILQALKNVILKLEEGGIQREKIVLVAGIGQHGKTFDLLDINGFYGLHGRTIPVAMGIRLANPDLTVICVAGDGDCYAEGLDHLIFGAKRNLDITVLVYDNRVYGLTTGQFTPTSPEGYRSRSTPTGVTEPPLNPMELMFASGATFLARAYTRRREQLEQILREAVHHRGFSFVDILQICTTYNDLTEYYNARVYDWKEAKDIRQAWEQAREWDYTNDAKIGLGVLYRRKAPLFEDAFPVPESLSENEREVFIASFLEERT